MTLSHKIALDPTVRQAEYFRRAAGTTRFVYNWGLAEWNSQYKAGGRPTGHSIKRLFNATYPELFPWVKEAHSGCHSQPFIDLQRAFGNFFSKRAQWPTFKCKGKARASFYVPNHTFYTAGKSVRLPRIGRVKMHEALRLTGKIHPARVVEEAGKWFLCVSVDVGELRKKRDGSGTAGVDLGIRTLVTLSTGEQIENPRPLRKAQKKLRRAQCKLSRRVKGSQNRNKQRMVVAKIHRRIRNIRHDGLHKLTTRLCRENQAVGIEDLAVSNMQKNHKLAQAISDAGFSKFRSLLAYKAEIYGTKIVVADRFFPSSKTCSSCGLVKGTLSLGERTFQCECGVRIDRDLNAAINLRKLAAACGEVTATETLRSVGEVVTKQRSITDAL